MGGAIYAVKTCSLGGEGLEVLDPMVGGLPRTRASCYEDVDCYEYRQ